MFIFCSLYDRQSFLFSIISWLKQNQYMKQSSFQFQCYFLIEQQANQLFYLQTREFQQNQSEFQQNQDEFQQNYCSQDQFQQQSYSTAQQVWFSSSVSQQYLDLSSTQWYLPASLNTSQNQNENIVKTSENINQLMLDNKMNTTNHQLWNQQSWNQQSYLSNNQNWNKIIFQKIFYNKFINNVEDFS